jgi:hypothetical protein
MHQLQCLGTVPGFEGAIALALESSDSEAPDGTLVIHYEHGNPRI